LSVRPEDGAATSGFISALLFSLVGNNGAIIWLSASRTIFPPALIQFGLAPDRFIFVDLKREKEILWAMEEALKCNALSAVVGEMREISFTASRRLQLAVEESQVTGFVIRNGLSKTNTTACVSRWRIAPLPGIPVDDLPGVGFPRWKVDLLRIRNGKPGSWNIGWKNGRFDTVGDNEREVRSDIIHIERKAG
jgi:protein ImuA